MIVSLDDIGIDHLKQYSFVPKWRYLNPEEPSLESSTGEIKNEPMLYNCSVEVARKLGGPLTNEFIDRLQKTNWFQSGESIIIDSRVHMLMKGWFPCIPGWHLDDFFRGPNGQPDLENAPRDMRHCMMLISDNSEWTSRTQFLDGPVNLSQCIPGENLYACYNRQIRKLVQSAETGIANILPGKLLEFGISDFHRGVPSRNSNWRWFIRATKGSTRKPTNELRNQVQVYLSALEEGW